MCCCTTKFHSQYFLLPFDQETCALLLEELRLEVQRSQEHVAGPAVAEGGPAGSFVLVIDGRTLEHVLQEELQGAFLELSRRCRAVVCCRSTPLQKSQVVRLVRDQLGVMTLAVGMYCRSAGQDKCM